MERETKKKTKGVKITTYREAMGLTSNMRSSWWLRFSLLIMVVVVLVNPARAPPPPLGTPSPSSSSPAPSINFQNLDPCKRPGGPHPGCNPPGPNPPGQDPKGPSGQANNWTRGCNPITRCRVGTPP